VQQFRLESRPRWRRSGSIDLRTMKSAGENGLFFFEHFYLFLCKPRFRPGVQIGFRNRGPPADESSRRRACSRATSTSDRTCAEPHPTSPPRPWRSASKRERLREHVQYVRFQFLRHFGKYFPNSCSGSRRVSAAAQADQRAANFPPPCLLAERREFNSRRLFFFWVSCVIFSTSK